MTFLCLGNPPIQCSLSFIGDFALWLFDFFFCCFVLLGFFQLFCLFLKCCSFLMFIFVLRNESEDGFQAVGVHSVEDFESKLQLHCESFTWVQTRLSYPSYDSEIPHSWNLVILARNFNGHPNRHTIGIGLMFNILYSIFVNFKRVIYYSVSLTLNPSFPRQSKNGW